MPRIVVIGGGAAGTGAATLALQQDRTAQVTLITEFEDIAYSPCGIPYVFGREIDVFDGLFLQPLDHYRKLGIDLRTETVVTAVDPGRKVVRAGGQEVPYDTLVLCTGWEYEPPKVPGLDLDGVIWDETACQRSQYGSQFGSVSTSLLLVVVRRSEQWASKAFSDDESLWDSRVA